LPVPWLDIFAGIGAMFGATLLLVSVLTWVSTRWSTFAVPAAVGITGTVVGLMLALSGWSDVWARVFPWSMAISAVAPIDQQRTLEGHMTAIGFRYCRWIDRRDCWRLGRRPPRRRLTGHDRQHDPGRVLP
jgi:hypothetical protein